MKHEETMQSLNMKLFGAIGALLAASVLMVGSTLAWFTVSTAPEVRQVDVNVSSAKNFEIARATDKTTAPGEVTSNDMGNANPETTWGQTITYGGEGSDLDLSLDIPATIDGGSLATTIFDETSGRTAGLTSEGIDLGEMQDGIAFYTYTNGEITKNCAAVMGFWLRTNTTGEISVTLPSDGIEISGGNTEISTDMVGYAVKIGESGDFTAAPVGETTPLGSLEAGKEGTYCEMIVYLNGGDENSEGGVVAYDVGGDDVVTITIKDIKFNNSNVPEDANT